MNIKYTFFWEIIKLGLYSISVFLAVGLALSIPLCLLWNWLVPHIFGLPTINILEAFGLSALVTFLTPTSIKFNAPKKKVKTDNVDKQLEEVLNLFFEAGGTLIDSSPMYGKSEAIIGQLLNKIDPNIKTFLATKVWTNGKQNGIEEMSQSLHKMGCSRMDLMQIHNLVDADTHLKTLKEWREEGKIKYIGITHYTDNAFDELANYLKEYPEIDFCQFPYSIARREAEKYFLDLCDDLEVATLINRPFEQDDLFEVVPTTEIRLIMRQSNGVSLFVFD